MAGSVGKIPVRGYDSKCVNNNMPLSFSPLNPLKYFAYPKPVWESL
jgi:hypothetical protein